MATHRENGEQRHFIEMFRFKRLEKRFSVRIFLTHDNNNAAMIDAKMKTLEG